MGQRVIWHVWDAAAHWAVHRLLGEGELPALRSLVERGTLTRAEPSWPNAQTPAALATLFTGLDPADHGVTGFKAPDLAAGILGWRRGFAAETLGAAPIWEQLDRCADAILVHVPWALRGRGDADGSSPRFAIDGYSNRRRRGAAIVLDGAPVDPEALPLGSTRVRQSAAGLVAVESAGGSRMQLGLDWGWRAWTPAEGPPTLVGAVQRPVDGVPMLLQLGAWETRTQPGTAASAAVGRVAPFVGEGLGRFYRRGDFGPTLRDGGGGGAERILLSTVEQTARYFTTVSEVALDRLEPGSLTIVYQPCVDELGHELSGLCDPTSPVFDPALEGAAWRALRAGYRWADAHLATLLRHADEETLVVVSSDHGMAGISHDVHANAILERAGLLAFGRDGAIDPSATQVGLSSAGDGSIWVNSVDRPGGWVPRSRAEETLYRAERALKAVRETGSGRPVVGEVLRRRDGLRPELGDAYLTLAPGFHLASGPAPAAGPVAATRKCGGHLTNTGEPSLAGIFAAAGPGLPEPWMEGTMANREVAPWLFSVLAAAPGPRERVGKAGAVR